MVDLEKEIEKEKLIHAQTQLMKTMKTRWKKVKINIPTDENGRALYWFDCEFCKGYVLKMDPFKKDETSVNDMQIFHKDGHHVAIIELGTPECHAKCKGCKI